MMHNVHIPTPDEVRAAKAQGAQPVIEATLKGLVDGIEQAWNPNAPHDWAPIPNELVSANVSTYVEVVVKKEMLEKGWEVMTRDSGRNDAYWQARQYLSPHHAGDDDRPGMMGR